jgi:2OG-Fe(II) oxygenase superfamily
MLPISLALKGMEVIQSDYGCGDSHLQLDFLPRYLAENVFACLADEVSFSKMTLKEYPVPRLVAIQGELIDGVLEPVYRHPTDLQPELTTWTPTILKIRQALNDATGLNLNHVLIQLYRSGEDNISPHTDKTLDILRGTSIYTMSFGAKRTLILRSKVDKSGSGNSDLSEAIDSLELKSNPPFEKVQRIPLPHNSLFILGSRTNSQYLHSIKADKRMSSLKTPEELFCNGQRISLTFRCIATFYNRTLRLLSGQGAVKTLKNGLYPPSMECSSDHGSRNQDITSTDEDYLTQDEKEEGKVKQVEIEKETEKGNEKEKITGIVEDKDNGEEIEKKDLEDDRDRLINAFGVENRESDFDWDKHYGRGFRTMSRTFKAGTNSDEAT